MDPDTHRGTLTDSSQRDRLSDALRAGSAAEHRSAEGSAFVGALLTGSATRRQYAAYLVRLRVVYAALEAAVHTHREHPAVSAVYDEDLDRTEALDRDLEHWAPGPRHATDSVAAAAYRERIEAAARSPELLVAHHYTRYLGDLSGGRMLDRALRRGGEEQGLTFYQFPAVPKPVTYKRAYRERLDALELTGAQRGALVEEVRRAFRLNRDLLDEVAALGGAPV